MTFQSYLTQACMIRKTTLTLAVDINIEERLFIEDEIKVNSICKISGNKTLSELAARNRSYSILATKDIENGRKVTKLKVEYEKQLSAFKKETSKQKVTFQKPVVKIEKDKGNVQVRQSLNDTKKVMANFAEQKVFDGIVPDVFKPIFDNWVTPRAGTNNTIETLSRIGSDYGVDTMKVVANVPWPISNRIMFCTNFEKLKELFLKPPTQAMNMMKLINNQAR